MSSAAAAAAAAAHRQTGEKFMKYLENEDVSPPTEEELLDIYNSGFKDSEGGKLPHFDSVLEELLSTGRVRITQGVVSMRRENKGGQAQGRSPGCVPQGPPGAPAPSSGPSTSRADLERDILKEYTSGRSKALMSDTKGIKITSDCTTKSGKVVLTVETLHKTYYVTFSIKNSGSDSVSFTFYNALSHVRVFTMEDRTVTRANPVLLNPGGSQDVKVACELDHSGYFPAVIYFEFSAPAADASDSLSGYFNILKKMAASTRPKLAAQLGPVAPFKPPSRLKSSQGRRVTKSVLVMLSGPIDQMEDYQKRFHTQIDLEERARQEELSRHDLCQQTLTQDPSNHKLFTLRFPSDAGNQPSLIRGNCLQVSQSGGRGAPIFKASVHQVELDCVTLSLPAKFLQIFSSDLTFDVKFVHDPYMLNLQHRAVNLAVRHRLGEVLFPSAAGGEENLPLPQLSMFDPNLAKNPEQQAAVQHIVAGSSKPAPYVVFGPPGTGKTSTLVEAMQQVIAADPSAHILACAPSNSACDLLCQRLRVPLGPKKVYRMFAACRYPRSVPQDLLDSCNLNQTNNRFEFPGKEVVQKYQVVVTTLYSAARLVFGGIQPGHFTHVFVDESGQATEPECLIAIAGLLNPKDGQLVLAGDPKQLGPIVQSTRAKENGFDISLLERLMTRSAPYLTKNNRYFVKLLRNYRSHPAILKVPNQLFYNDEVQPLAKKLDRETYCQWGHLQKKGFPVIFHNVMGRDEREASSLSFFNLFEIDTLVDYLAKLMQTQGKNGLPTLSADHIGIIAPYRKQIQKIQKALQVAPALQRWSQVQDIKVGCVEEFQGDERKIILVSTVRSSDALVSADRRLKIGFLSNPKRFNVAVTRATSLLIVIGNAALLSKDPYWGQFIEYCEQQGGFRDGSNNGIMMMSQLKISAHP